MDRVVIREAIPTDYEDIEIYYREHPDPHVMLRSPEAVWRAIRSGVFFLAIDPAGKNSGRICGASAVYDIETAMLGGGAASLREAGGSNIKREARGFGIHKIFHAARALHTFALDAGGFHEYFGAILTPNIESERNIVLMGFEEWSDVPPALRLNREKFIRDDGGIKFFKLSTGALPQIARKMLEFYNKPILERRINGNLEQIDLVLDIEITKRYIDIVKLISDGDVSYFRDKERRE